MKKSLFTIKSLSRRTVAAALGAALLAGASASAFAQSIGVSFVGVSSSGVDNGETDSMLPGDLAGVPPYAQTNWNNLGQYGSIAPLTLTNSVGGVNNFTLQWDSGGAASTGSAGLGTGDGKLMDGFIYTYAPGSATSLGDSVYNSSINNKPLVYFGGLNAWYTAAGAEGYTVVLYTTGNNYYETAEGWIESVTGDPTANNMVEGSDLTAHVFEQDTSPYTGTYVQATGTSSGTQTGGANYMVFPGLTNDAVLIRLQCPGGYGAGLNGFQFVPVFPSPPTVGTPTISPSSTVYAGVPATLTEAATGDPFHPALYYQWQSDNGTGGPVTNNISGATNATYTVTPTNNVSTYAINYQVIVTNSSGAVTSSIVTLTVNPAVAPYITQDTTPGPATGQATIYAYAGGTVNFNAAFDGTRPITNQWQVSTGGNYSNIAGATSTNLTLASVGFAADGSYQLVASNAIGSLNSTPAPLVVLADPAAPTSVTAYPYDVFTNNPLAYWRLGETGDNVGNSLQAYDYSGNNFDGTYGQGVSLNNAGPQSPAYSGFETTNLAAGFSAGTPSGTVVVPPLNLNANTFTMTAWIYPTADAVANGGLFVYRNGNDAAGFGFGPTNSGGQYELGYVWNTNSPSTYNFNSGLFPPLSQWSFVALTITPTNATIYLYTTDGSTYTNLAKAVNPIAHIPESFSGGTTWLGGDPASPNRNFSGTIDEAAVFGHALSEAQVQDLYLKAIGAPGVAPTVTAATASTSVPVYSGQNVLLSAGASGTVPLTLQWQAGPNGVTWTNIPAATSSTLLVNPLAVGTINYQLVAANAAGSSTSTPVAVTFTALPASPAGLWTANFQVTNNVLNYTTGGGVGYYTGRGVLGTGMYWNVLPDNAGADGLVGSLTSVSDLKDDGATHSGVYCTLLNASGFSSATTPLPPYDLGNLLYQYVTITSPTSALQFHGVPDGTYNLTVYGIDGSFDDRGITVTVHDALNGNQTNSTENDLGTAVPLAQGVNFVLFTQVHVSGGTLLADVAPNANIASHPGNTEGDMNAAQLQLVSYDTSAPPVTVSDAFVGASHSLTLTWPEGILQTATNLLGPWTPVYAPSPITVTTTNATLFFRAQVHP